MLKCKKSAIKVLYGRGQGVYFQVLGTLYFSQIMPIMGVTLANSYTKIFRRTQEAVSIIHCSSMNDVVSHSSIFRLKEKIL